MQTETDRPERSSPRSLYCEIPGCDEQRHLYHHVICSQHNPMFLAMPDLLDALRDVLENSTNRSLGAIEANRHNAEIARRVIAKFEPAAERS